MRDSLSTYYQHHYAPAYPNGFGDTVAVAPKGMQPLTSYSEVGSREGLGGDAYEQSPAHSSSMLLLLVVAFLLIAYCYSHGVNLFRTLVHNLWSVSRHENHLDEHTSNERVLLFALIAVSWLMGGVVIYTYIRNSDIGFSDLGMVKSVGVSIVVAVVYYIIQLLSVALTGYVFADSKSCKLWLQGFNSSQVFLGLFLTPVAVGMLFAPEYSHELIMVSICLCLSAKALFYIKGFRIFYKNLFSCFYFISYLCTAEIAPLYCFIINAQI